MFSTSGQQNYIIQKNETLETEVRQIRTELLTKKEENLELEKDNERMEERIRYQRGLISNLFELSKMTDKILLASKSLSKVTQPKTLSLSSRTVTLSLLGYILSLVTISYFFTPSLFTFDITVSLSAFLLLRQTYKQEQRYIQLRNSKIRDLMSLANEFTKVKKANDYVQELIDNV